MLSEKVKTEKCRMNCLNGYLYTNYPRISNKLKRAVHNYMSILCNSSIEMENKSAFKSYVN